jgi:starvation-inducible outer membrane lipoprotein
MNKVMIMLFAAVLFLFAACDSKEKEIEQLRSDNPNAHVVEVIEHLDASNYTYMKVEEKDDEYWIAVPQMEVEDGAILYFTKSMKMQNFRSESLDRTFESILFVEDISQTPHSTDGKMSHPNVESSREDIKVEPLDDGYTISKLFDEKESLAGKKVKVKGKVVKYNEGIMDRNWIHIQDGTGEQGKHDLVVTTSASVQIGQTIIAEGIIAVDKDFGSGYTYSVLLEDAEIKSE